MRIYLSRPHMSGHEEAASQKPFRLEFVPPSSSSWMRFEPGSTRVNLAADVHCVGPCRPGSAALHLGIADLPALVEGDEVWISSNDLWGGFFPVKLSRC